MNRFVPAIGAIIILNYFLVDEEKIEQRIKHLLPVFTIGILGLSTGITFIPAVSPYAPFVSFSIAIVCYGILAFIINKIGDKNENNLQTSNTK